MMIYLHVLVPLIFLRPLHPVRAISSGSASGLSDEIEEGTRLWASASLPHSSAGSREHRGKPKHLGAAGLLRCAGDGTGGA